MKRRSLLVLPALFALMLPLAFAGEGYKCTKSTQECLDMMAASYRAHGWAGLELDKTDSGALTVKRVVADSPAEAAGFKAGDVLVAVNGVKYAEDNEKALKAVKKDMAPGKKVVYTISRGGATKEIGVTLAQVPNEVLAQMIGTHMLDHAQVAQAK